MAMHRGGGGSSGVRLTPVSQGGAGSGGSTPQLSARSLTGRGASSVRSVQGSVQEQAAAARVQATRESESESRSAYVAKAVPWC